MATISADIYFDGVNGNDAEDGSTALLAKKSIGYFSHANNHLVNAGVTIYLANGSDWNVTEEVGSEQRLMYRGNGTAADPITVTNYVPANGSTVEPKLHNFTDIASGDWTDIGGGDWTYTLNISVANNSNYENYGIWTGASLTDALEKTFYTSVGSTLTVTSGASNPTDTWGGFRLCYLPVFLQFSDSFFNRGGRVYHGLNCSYAFSLVTIYSTTLVSPSENNHIYNNTISYVGRGISSKNGDSANDTVTVEVNNNTISYCNGPGIQAEGSKNINWEIHHNNVSYCNLANSYGGIMLHGFGSTGTVNNHKVYENDISYCIHGKGATTFDGAGIYNETGCIGNHIYDNKITFCHHAIQDNTGERASYTGNLIAKCDIAMVQSDQKSRGNADIIFNDNVCADMTYTALEHDASATSPLTAILSFPDVNGTFDIQNNIITGAAGTTGDAIRINTGSTYVAKYNNFNVGDEDIVNTSGVAQSVDATNKRDSDPLFIDAANGNYRLQQSSDCVGTGVKWWGTGPRPSGWYGEPKPDTYIDIGFQSTWNPLHPRNM